MAGQMFAEGSYTNGAFLGGASLKRFLLLSLLALAPLLPIIHANAKASSGISISTTADGIKLTLVAPQRSYPRNALVRFAVAVENVSNHRLQVRLGAQCSYTNPDIEVLDAQGHLFPHNPSSHGESSPQPPRAYNPFPGCERSIGLRWLQPGQAAHQRDFAVLGYGYVRAVMKLGADLAPHTMTPEAHVLLTTGKPPIATLKHSNVGPYVTIQRPLGAKGRLYFVETATCFSASSPVSLSSRPLWSPVIQGNRVYSGCYGKQEWHGYAGYLNYPVATIDYTSP
jgi:hypothetical protein